MLELKFSHVFEGILWNTVALPEEEILFVEVRDHVQKRVTFAALQYSDNRFLWREAVLEEPWWVALAGAAQGLVFFTLYIDTHNPDRKGILAYTLQDLTLRWWHNDFSLAALEGHVLRGVTSGAGARDLLLDLASGKELAAHTGLPESLPDATLRPQQYGDGTDYFRTVGNFLQEKLNLSAVLALEYLEYNGKIFIAYYLQEQTLASYLCVLSDAGEILLHEKTDEHLKGIGQDTFFILSGCLFFVKNKHELLSYFL
jgi:hypothetical protein